MSFDDQKAQIESMITEGQQRVEQMSSKYRNYIKENKQISTELEELVKKLKECTGNLGKIGEAYERSRNETKKMEADFETKVQQSNADSERKNQEAEERIQKQKQELESAAAAQKQELETKMSELKKADEALLAQQKKDNEDAMNLLKKQKAEADALAAQQMEQSKQEAAKQLEAAQKEAEEKLMKQHNFDEEAKARVRMQLEEFRTKAAKELEDLKNEAAAAKETSDKAHDEALKQQKTQNEELLAKKDETHKAAIETMKADFEKQRDELKASLEGQQGAELEKAKQKCQQERQNLVDQIVSFQDSIKQLTENQDEEVKISLQGFKDTVTDTCSKIQAIQDKMPKDDEVKEEPAPTKTTEQIPTPPQTPTPPAILEERKKAGDQAKRDKISKNMPGNFSHFPRLRSGGAGMNPNWLFKDDVFAYEMCANRNDGPEKCGPEVIKTENDRVINAFAPFREDRSAQQRYEQHVKYAFIELKLGMEKEKVVDDKHDHKLRVWMRVWFMKYMMAFPEKQKKIPTVEEHKKWYDLNLKYQVDLNNYKRIAVNLDKLGHGVKHSGRRGRRHSKRRSRSLPPQTGGYRYGMKMKRRRTLRSKLKTQRLKSLKKNRKRKGKKSRKKRRIKKTAKNRK